MVMAALVVVGGGFAVWAVSQDGTATFCTLGLPIYEHDGVSGTLEDHGMPGRDDCDGPDHSNWGVTLGFDCLVRTPEGKVIDAVEPNRADGTCGLPGPGEEWPD